MKSNHFIILILIILGLSAMYSCKGPEGLPLPAALPFEVNGAHIQIENLSRQYTRGELIATNEQGVYVLMQLDNDEEQWGGKELKLLPWNEIKAYTLHYAKGKDQNWRILVYTLGTLSHGFFAVFTLPINLIATSVAASNFVNEYALRDSELPRNDLWKYARFPQGIPEGVALGDIR
jgi:hypothetical protein